MCAVNASMDRLKSTDMINSEFILVIKKIKILREKCASNRHLKRSANSKHSCRNSCRQRLKEGFQDSPGFLMLVLSRWQKQTIKTTKITWTFSVKFQVSGNTKED